MARQVTISRRGALAGLGAAGLVRPALAATTELVVGAAVFPDSLMPGIPSFASESLLKQINEPLFTRDNAGELVPALATKAEQVDDTTTRFTMRPGVMCHDGTPFTAEDAAFTINYILDVKNGYGLLARIAPILSATAIDAGTLEIKTKAVFPTLLKGLSFILMQPKHYLEKVGLKGVQAHPMGTGPFVFKRWSAGDRYELTANKAYWGGAPKAASLVIREIPDPGTRIASLVSGETHIIEEVPVDLIPQIENSGNARMDEIVSTAGLVLTYDTRSPPFDDPRVRLAFDYAVDKAAIQKEMLKGRGELLQGQLLTSTTFGFNPAVKARPFDPDKAKALLKEVKFDFAKPIPIMTQSGKYASDVDICNAVAGMLNNAGVNVTVDVVEGGVFLQRQTAFRSGPIHMVGWYSLGDADFANVWYTKGGKRSVWSNEEYERLFVEGRSTNDREARLKAYDRMAEILHEENPSMFLFGLPSLYGVNKKVTGFGAASDKCLRLNGAIAV